MENTLNPKFEKLVRDPRNWLAFQRLLDAAAAIVGDFDAFGEVLQSSESGSYDETTNIEKLRGTIVLIDSDMVPYGDYFPWLSEEQQKKLEELAIEVLAQGNGNGDQDDQEARLNAKANAESMLPRERLEATGYSCGIDRHVQIKKRLGFDPYTGEAV